MKKVQMMMMNKVSSSLAVTFTTNKNGVFNPSITTSDLSISRWSVDGELDQFTNTPSFTLDGTDKVVSLFIIGTAKINSFTASDQNIKGSIDLSLLTHANLIYLDSNLELTSIINPINDIAITQYRAYGCNLTGTLDLSGFSQFGGNIQLYSNPNLTGITFPSSSNIFSQLLISSCNITGTLDLSGLSGLGGNINIASNPNLTSISHPTSTQSITDYQIQSCNITGILDLSGLSGLGGFFRANSNPNLTNITFPSSSNIFTLFYIYSCNITGTLDLSGLSGLGGNLQLYNNINLTDVLLPITSVNFSNFYIYSTSIGVLNWSNVNGSITTLRIDNNSFTSDESDENIVLIDNNVNLTSVLQIAGTNGALTDGSGTGFDGLAAKDQLIIEGITVTYN